VTQPLRFRKFSQIFQIRVLNPRLAVNTWNKNTKLRTKLRMQGGPEPHDFIFLEPLTRSVTEMPQSKLGYWFRYPHNRKQVKIHSSRLKSSPKAMQCSCDYQPTNLAESMQFTRHKNPTTNIHCYSHTPQTVLEMTTNSYNRSLGYDSPRSHRSKCRLIASQVPTTAVHEISITEV
jgi:hypothetical protein